MKQAWQFVVCTAAGLAAASGPAATPQLEAGALINDGAAPLNAGLYSAPTVADWNGDGKVDLLLGQFTNGYIYLFLNQAATSNAIPVLNGGTPIQSGGSALTTSWG